MRIWFFQLEERNVFLGFRNEIYLFLFDHILYLFFDALFKFCVSFLKTGVPFVVLKIQIFSQFPNHKAGRTGP